MKGFLLCLAALIVSIFVFCCPAWAATTAEFSIWLDGPAQAITIPVQYGLNRLDDGFIKIHKEGGPNQSVDLAVTELKQGNNTARLVMVCKGVETIICSREASSKIPFKITGLDVQGDYTGTMTLEWGGSTKRKKEVTVTVRKQTMPKDIEVVGTNRKDDKIQLVLGSPDAKSITFTLKNPVDGLFRKLELENIYFRSGQRMVEGIIRPECITLDQGQSEVITLKFDDKVPKGDYEGSLIITDANNDKIEQKITIVLSTPFMNLSDIFNYDNRKIYFLVFLGTIASLFLTLFEPISATKRGNRQNIDACEDRTKGLTDYEIKLKQKLLVELARAKTVNDNTKFCTPSARDRLKTVSDAIARISARLDMRDKVQSIRELTEKDLPFSEYQELWGLLDSAGSCIYAANIEAAEKIMQEAMEKYSKFIQGDQVTIDNCIAKVCNKIKELRNVPAETDEQPLRLPFIEKLKEELLDNDNKEKPIANATNGTQGESNAQKYPRDLEYLKKLDLKCSKVDIYYNRFLKDVKWVEEGARSEAKAEVEDFFKSDEYHKLRKIVEYCDSFRIGITKKKVESEIKEKHFEIVSEPSDPSVNEPVDFRIVFNAAKINESPLVDDFLFVWDFNDNTKKITKFKVTHYFKRRGIFILLRKWIRRNLLVMLNASRLPRLARSAENLKEWKEFTLTVDVYRDDNNAYLSQQTKNVPVSEPIDKEYSSGITVTNVLSYVVMLALSCMLAVIDTLSENYTFKSLKDYLTPILLGFTLDTFKDTLLNPTNLLGKIKKP